MASIWTMGEILVEIMRPRSGIELYEPGEFLGPYPSGAPAIFIDTVARLGHKAGMIAGVGEDDFGRCVVERLQDDGVNCESIRTYPHRSTAVAFVTYFHDGSRKFIFHIDGTPAVMAEFQPTGTGDIPTYFHIMGCSLMANDTFRARIFQAMMYFHQQGSKITFDPNIRPELLGERGIEEIVGPVLARCSILFPGTTELKMISGNQDVEGSVRHLFARKSLDIVVLKRGKKGCTIYTRDRTLDIPAYQVEEIDPTGAGDCFDAAFLCGLLEGKDPEDCGRMAAAAGALNAIAFGPMEGDISHKTIEALIKTAESGR
ncbi:MAG: sugar kinase [Chloroflexi bacterium]|nr:sugar kinase [Chloroflexota bacterium]